MLKRIVSCLLAVAVLSSPVWAGGKQEQKAAPGGKTTIRVAWWGSQSRHERTIKAIELYQQKHPEVTIQPEFSGWDGYWEKKSAEAAAGNLPEVFQQDYQFIEQYALKDLLLNLSPYVQDNRLDLRDAAQTSYVSGVIGGKLYGINLGTNAPCVIYDPALFKKAGIAEPKPDWTWQDYVSIVRALHQKLGIYGDGDVPGGYNFGPKYVARQKGQAFYSADRKSIGFDDSVFTSFFGTEFALVKEGALPLPDVRLEIKGAENQLIVTQKSAILSSYQSNQLIAIQKAANRPLAIIPLPVDPNQKAPAMWLKAAMFFSAAKTASQPDQAVAFINYFVNDIEANKVMLAERGIPISSKVSDALKPLMGATDQQVFDYIAYVTKNSSPIDPPDPAGYAEIYKLLQNIEAQIGFGKITAEDGAKQFREQANQILSKK
jgi:multiple sugar transport system substrate-binding protein